MENIWLREGISGKLKEVDSLVLDIDGVIVWVAESFRQAICQGVQFYLNQVLEWPEGELAIEPHETEFFKQAGGFNNDWDLALAVLILYLSKASRFNHKKIRELKKSGWSIEEYTYYLAQEGGGLASVEKILRQKIDVKVQETLATICKEIYAGEEFYQELYGDKIKYVKGKESLIHKEEVILNTSKLLGVNKKLAIVTGRTWSEAKLVLRKVGLLEYIPREHILTEDDGLRKPDPETLNVIAKRLGTKLGMFIGDTLDDLRTTKGTNVPFMAACVLSGAGGKEGENIFRQEGAGLIAPQVNSILDLLT